jgi:pimeloyl-ACP methyl ester carboxylesterase
MWQAVAQELPPGLLALTPVNLGYSAQAPLQLRSDGRFHLEDEVAHLRKQVPDRASALHLVAHSYGGCVALMLAQDPSLPVASLWLYEPVPFAALRHLPPAELPEDVRQQLDQLYAEDSPLLDAAQAGTDTWLQTFIDYWNGPGTWAAVPEKVRQGARSVGVKMFHEVQALSTLAPAFAQLTHAAPMTLVHGERTQPPARHMAACLAQVNPQARVEELAGLGHMGIAGSPQAVRDSLAAHWARVHAA